MRSSHVTALLLATSACTAGTEANLADVSGHWMFTETLEDRIHGFSCADTGTYDIQQQGDRFQGTWDQRGLCLTPSGTVNNADSGTLGAGRVIGRTVRFMVTANCEYEGTATGRPAELLSGSGVCVLHDADRILTFRGGWQATRQPSSVLRPARR